jgi:phosphatidylinositol kinase/protein kinase (PI-3  family)
VNLQTKNELTRKKSKSIFSKSLSVLEKAKRIFHDLEKDESDISKRKDVKLRDVAAKSSSDIRDVL